MDELEEERIVAGMGQRLWEAKENGAFMKNENRQRTQVRLDL